MTDAGVPRWCSIWRRSFIKVPGTLASRNVPTIPDYLSCRACISLCASQMNLDGISIQRQLGGEKWCPDHPRRPARQPWQNLIDHMVKTTLLIKIFVNGLEWLRNTYSAHNNNCWPWKVLRVRRPYYTAHEVRSRCAATNTCSFCLLYNSVTFNVSLCSPTNPKNSRRSLLFILIPQKKKTAK